MTKKGCGLSREDRNTRKQLLRSVAIPPAATTRSKQRCCIDATTGLPRAARRRAVAVQSNRYRSLGGLDAELLNRLLQLFHINPYHNFFMGVRELDNLDSYTIMLRANPTLDANVYNLPSVDQVAAIWNEGIGPSMEQPKDIRVNLKSGGVSFVHYYYGCYDPLQYVLLFPYGEPGWHAVILKSKRATDIAVDDYEEVDIDLLETMVDPSLHKQGESLLTAEHSSEFFDFMFFYCMLAGIFLIFRCFGY